MSDDNGSWSRADLEAMAAIPDVPAVSDVQLAHLAAIRFPVGSDAEMIRSTASELQQRRAALPTLEGRALADLGAQVAALRAELAAIDGALARRPALDKPTRAANVAFACAENQRLTDALAAKDARIAELEAGWDAKRVKRQLWRMRAEQAEARVEELLEAADVTRCQCRWENAAAGYPLSECGWHSHQRVAKEQAEADVARLRAAGRLYAEGEISAGKLAEVLGVEDTAGFRMTANADDAQREADVAKLRAALESIANNSCCGPCLEARNVARAALRATCPTCHGTGVNGERRSDGAPLVCTECGR